MEPKRHQNSGNADKNLSPYLKCWVMQGNTCVVGAIGEGTTKEIQVNWNSPFEEDTIGGTFQKIGGLVQEETGRTSKTLLSSAQIWEGNQPHQFNLVMKFYALSDAKAEVMDPCRELEKMLSPNVNASLPFEVGSDGDLHVGRVPGRVWINVGRNALYGPCVITGMTMPLDKEKTKDGYLIRCEVNLQVETKQMLNRSDIDKTYG
ncbi:hypothetical protein [Desulfosarcina cetonica]|uniref:hypothetical protein n=1 Tax=Desulfosarcina cetonica TaxID=90730 RepID=UPI0012EE9BB3|nr:hypothetical protein [Desulfosarcina cetonica]